MLPFKPAYLWVDMEMTGLNPFTDTIIEFACILSDEKFTQFEQGPHIIIHCEKQRLDKMSEWCIYRHHVSSGLYKTSIESDITLKQAQQLILIYLKDLGIENQQLRIAGNSVHMDKLFLLHHMPRLNQFLHYRILDVTSLKIIVNTVNPSLFYKKKGAHRAMDDIRESIGELQFYMQHFFSQ